MKWVIKTPNGEFVAGSRGMMLPVIGNFALLTKDPDNAMRFRSDMEAIQFMTHRGWLVDNLSVEELA